MQQAFYHNSVKIDGGFWENQRKINAETAIHHQWKQLVKSGSIENFRILAGESPHSRTGFFFSDSDVYKWLEAACLIYLYAPSQKLKNQLHIIGRLIKNCQTQDGYLYTYNQIHFPKKRWVALQIEHELYCHGHLIEACLAYQDAFPQQNMLDTAILAADLICQDFLDKPPHFQPGHQEIELALIKLYETTGVSNYLIMAKGFLDRRGKTSLHGLRLLASTVQSGLRGKLAEHLKNKHYQRHPNLEPFELPAMNKSHSSLPLMLRFIGSSFSGKYFQTHKPIQHQKKPVGHAVRFGYTMAAQTRRLRFENRLDEIKNLEKLWQEMVTKRMYLTGGLGALPIIEGFGRDYELDPQKAYAETCAGIASLLWNWEMLLSTGKACFADLFEWQLYNAVLVGVGLKGQSYLYNNSLKVDGELTRESWFRIPCCPSNISRLFASLGKFIYSTEGQNLFIHQYISNQMKPDLPSPITINLKSGFPFDTSCRMEIIAVNDPDAALSIRVPGWASGVMVSLNNKRMDIPYKKPAPIPTAGGFSLVDSDYLILPTKFQVGDIIRINFQCEITAVETDPKVGLDKENTALTSGPLVYCLESVDNIGIDLDKIKILPETFTAQPSNELWDMTVINGISSEGEEILLIPYFAWGNRGKSKMRVFLKQKNT